VVWAADTGIALEQCVFVGNAGTEIDAVEMLRVENCVFDVRVPLAAMQGRNIVMVNVAPIELPMLETGPCGGGRRIGGARVLEDPTPSPSDLPNDDDNVPEIVGIIFMVIMLCCLILPVIYVVWKYRKRIEKT
jgi:hypothetical protein